MSSFIFPDSFTRKAFGQRGHENDRKQRTMMRKREQKMEMLRKIQNDTKMNGEPLKKKRGFRISRVAWIIIALLTLLMVLIMTSCFEQQQSPGKMVGQYEVTTFEHDGCLWIMAHRYSAVSLVHHPRCTNHETKFR